MALERKFITPDQVEKAKAEQKSLADRGVERSLWFLVQDLGYVDQNQTKELRRNLSSTRVKALEIEGYIIQGRLGSGGMGDVFRGRNAAGDEVAVKLLSTKYSQHEEFAARFQREAKASARLKHPHIARTLSAGDVEGQRWLMMELVPGKSLKESITSDGPLPEAEAKVLLAQMAHALRYAWQRGVLHRDVKPANIILAPAREGYAEPYCAKICDFGLAKTWQIAGEEAGALTRGELTHSGVALGTPHYMSPEQASGEADLDQRTDIYGLGATLYHALLGHTLYSGKSSAAIMYKQVTEALDLKPLTEKGVSPGFVRVVGAMLTKDRARRLRDWEAVISALRAVAPRVVASVELGMPVGSSSDTLHAITDQPASAPPAKPAASPLMLRRFILISGLIVIAGLASLVLVAAAFLVLGGSGNSMHARPDTITEVLLAAQKSGAPTTVVLESGDYQGPFSFGIAHNHLTLVAAGPGVRLVASSIGDEPLLRLQTGLSDFTLRNVALVCGRRLAIDVQSGASARFEQIRIDGGCHQVLAMGGGALHITGLTAQSSIKGLVVEGRGDLHLIDTAIACSGPALVMRYGTLVAERCRFSGIGVINGALVSLGAVKAEMAAVIIEAQGCDVALSLDGLNEGRFRDVSLRGARTALRADSANLSRIDGLTVDGLDVGIEWIGTRNPSWTWQGLSVRAARPVIGLSGVELRGAGARSDQLQTIPLNAAPAPH